MPVLPPKDTKYVFKVELNYFFKSPPSLSAETAVFLAVDTGFKGHFSAR